MNTTDTRVRIHFQLSETQAFPRAVRDRLMAKLQARLNAKGELVITCDSSRSQHANLDEALDRLSKLLVESMKVQKKRRKTRPSKGAVRRRLEKKKQRSSVKKGRQRPRHDD